MNPTHHMGKMVITREFLEDVGIEARQFSADRNLALRQLLHIPSECSVNSYLRNDWQTLIVYIRGHWSLPNVGGRKNLDEVPEITLWHFVLVRSVNQPPALVLAEGT